MHAAAMVTCSQPGFSETVYNGTCSVGVGVNNTFSYEAYTRASIAGNVYTVQALSQVLSTPSNGSGPYPMSATASWNDVFTVPNSDPTDIFRITVTGGGLNHPASIEAGPISYLESDFCDAHYIGNSACTKEATISAADFSSLKITGSDSLSIDFPCGFGCHTSPNADLYEIVTVQRFLADGVTADPFSSAPEPSTIALIVLGIPAGLAFRKQRG
jgi:hypothetical protein